MEQWIERFRTAFWLGYVVVFVLLTVGLVVVGLEQAAFGALGLAIAGAGFFLAEVSDRELKELQEHVERLTTRVAALDGKEK